VHCMRKLGGQTFRNAAAVILAVSFLVCVGASPAVSCDYLALPWVEIPKDLHAFVGIVDSFSTLKNGDRDFLHGVVVSVEDSLLNPENLNEFEVYPFFVLTNCEPYPLPEKEQRDLFPIGTRVWVIGSPVRSILPGALDEAHRLAAWPMAAGFLHPYLISLKEVDTSPFDFIAHQSLISRITSLQPDLPSKGVQSLEDFGYYGYLRTLLALESAASDAERIAELRRLQPYEKFGRGKFYEAMLEHHMPDKHWRNRLMQEFNSKRNVPY
jgi:hypothetical protein